MFDPGREAGLGRPPAAPETAPVEDPATRTAADPASESFASAAADPAPGRAAPATEDPAPESFAPAAEEPPPSRAAPAAEDSAPESFAPMAKEPAPGRAAPALVEVILCSGFPTQIALSALLTAAGLAALTPAGDPSFGYVVTLTLLDVVLVVGLVTAFLRARGESVRALVLGARPPAREAALGILLTPPIVAAAVAGLLLVGWLAPGLRNVPDNPFGALLDTPGRALLFALVVVLAGGLREELQRAFVLRRFEQHLQRFGGGWLGLAVFSVAFGLGHAVQGWDTVIVTGALGALWGALYLTRGSAVAAMTSHTGFNLTQIALAVAATPS